MENKSNGPKKLAAVDILKMMRRAPAGNAIKLTDPDQYVLPKYSEFFAAIPQIDLSDEEKAQLDTLQEEINLLHTDQFYREDKMKVFFVLRLQEILYKGARI